MKISSIYLNIYLTQNEAALLITWWSIIQTHKCITIWKQTAACNKCKGTEMRIPLWTRRTPKKTHPTAAEINNNVPWPSHLQNCCHQVFQLLTLALHTLGWYLACWHKNRCCCHQVFQLLRLVLHMLGWFISPVDTKTCCCHQVFQLLTLELHMLGWYLACWHKNRCCCHQVFQLLTLALHMLGQYLACWHKNRDAVVTKFFSCWRLHSTRLAGTLPVDTKTEMLLPPSFSAVDTCVPHAWPVPCLLTQKQMLLSPSFPAVDTCAPHAWLVPHLLTQKHATVIKSFSCWHLRSTCLAGTLPVDTKTDAAVTEFFSC